MGDTIDDICLLFEVNNSSISTVRESCTSALQSTHGLPNDDFLPNISALFLESHTTDSEEFFDDLPLLFAGDDSFTVVVRSHSKPQVHSLHDQSL